MSFFQEKEGVAELCGAIIGDGWIQSNESNFFLAGNMTEDKDYYDTYISKLISNLIRPVTPKYFPYWSVYGVSFYDKKSIKTLLSFGLPKGKKVHIAQIPSWIKEANKKIKIAFLRGLFDTDGSIYCDKNHSIKNPVYHTKLKLSICSISKNLIYEVNEILNELKIKNFIKHQKSKNKRWKDSYYIIVDGGINVKKWFEIIGSENPKHITKFEIWKKFGLCPPRTTLEQRKKILKNRLNPYKLYCGDAGVVKRGRITKNNTQPQEHS